MLQGRWYIYTVSILLTFSTALFAFEVPSVTSKALGGTVQLSQSDVSEIVNSGLSFDSIPYGIELGFIRNYQLSDLDEYVIGGYYDYKNTRASFGVSQFGNPDLYTEQVFKMTLTYRYNRFQVGLNGSLRRYDFNSEFKSLTAGNLGFSFGFRHEYFVFGAFFEDIAKPKLTNLSNELPAATHLYLEVLSDTRYKTTASYNIYDEFDNRFGIGEEIEVTEKFSILAGFRTKPSTLSGGVKLIFGSKLMTYAIEHHPVLGLTHGISFTFTQ